MDFKLTKPCGNCPFRYDSLKGWLGEERAEEISTALIDQDLTFSCHKTNSSDDEGNAIETKNSNIVLEH